MNDSVISLFTIIKLKSVEEKKDFLDKFENLKGEIILLEVLEDYG